MKIAIVSLQFEATSTGGGGVHAENIIRQFLNLGQEVTVISIHTNKTLKDDLVFQGDKNNYSVEVRENLKVMRFLVDEDIEQPYAGDKDTELDRIMRFAKIVIKWLKENGTATISGANRGIQNVSVWFNGVKYNDTEGWPAENGTLVLELNHSGLGLIVNGTTNEVTIKVNTTANIATGQTIRFEFNRTLGTGYNATCNASTRTPYSNETGEINNTITVTKAPAAVSAIGLDEGWNLISLWLIPSSTSIDAVTADIEDNLYGVYYYDAYTGTWKSYFPEYGVSGSNLKTMTAGKGYWINMTAADTLPVSGNFLPSGMNTPPSYPLYEGWNLIGFHSENTSITASTYFGTQGTDWQSIFKWNNQTDSYETVTPSTTLNQGEGYWLAALKNYTVYPM